MNSKFMWVPLSMSIFGVELIQRGLATFANAKDLGISHLTEALSIYFLMMSIGVLVCGYFCDNFNSRKIILGATIFGSVGILTLPYTPLAFGLIFGAAAAFIKISPFSAPLKLKDGNDALRISPQSAAKNVGGALFILFLGGVVSSLGWTYSTIILSFIFLVSGIWSYYIVPNDKIEGWKWNIFIELTKDWKFWFAMVYFFFMSGLYYVAIKGFYPGLIKIGYSKELAMTTIAISFLIAGALRFFVSWLGDQIIFGYKVRLPLMWFGTVGMGVCIFLTDFYPLKSLILFTLMSSIHTPNYWAYCKEQWSSTYISTVMALAFSFMYLGSGFMYGKWTW